MFLIGPLRPVRRRHPRATRAAAGIVVAATALLMVAAVPDQASSSVDLGTLAPGRAVFFEGVAGPTVHTFRVTERASRLRVGFDWPYRESRYEVELVGPGGERFDSQDFSWSVELFVDDPAPGQWALEVGRGGEPYRVRARTDTDLARSAHHGLLAPNLRVIPPWDFTFQSYAGRSCLPDETIEHGARHCLRLALGFENASPGRFQLEFSPLEGVVTEGTMYQRLFLADGSSRLREAGRFEYHKTHAHYHHKGLGTLELFAASARTQTLRKVSTGPKMGFCMGEYRLADWWRFYQEPKGDDQSTCSHLPNGDPPSGQTMGLSGGWGDIYGAQLPGNYIEFSDDDGERLPNGRYVVLITSDAPDDLLETREDDNIGYAYIEVAGARVEVLERGRGRGPWDPRRTVVDDFHHDVRRP
ncbi:MAG: hypothetical protein M3N53_02710 [Actinomycetota bacterium]|nr:hypothetical protein [Actinomycetota bacterium]